MPDTNQAPLQELQQQAGEAAALLKVLANERRLLILCHLVGGEATVGELCEVAGLSQSAASQHLAKMRADGVVVGHKTGLQVFYSIADPRLVGLLNHLRSQFCTAAGELGI